MPRMKLGILANEFFDPRLGRTGGFGWAGRRVARLFQEDPYLGVDPVFLSGEVRGSDDEAETSVHGTRLLLKRSNWRRTLTGTRAEELDLVLTIDYRPSYRPFFWMLPRTPFVVWARDPRAPDEVRRIETLRIPGQEEVRPQGIDPIDCTSLGTTVRLSRLLGRPVLLASKMPHIADKLPATYGTGSPLVLPNPEVLDYAAVRPAEHPAPRVVFLGRLDPYKRPWLFVELARRFPGVEFVLLGQAHFRGPGAWEPADLPDNVRLMGHVDGAEKTALLSSAWVLVNTSIYEESPVSMLEALACETPILSCVDTGRLASRFGIHAGSFGGTGLEGLPNLVEGLAALLRDPHRRRRLGREGRRWVTAEHNSERFLGAFDELCALAGVSREPGSAGSPSGPGLPHPTPERARGGDAWDA